MLEYGFIVLSCTLIEIDTNHALHDYLMVFDASRYTQAHFKTNTNMYFIL